MTKKAILPTLSLATIEQFFQQQPIAVVGVSRNKHKFGSSAFLTMKNRGIQVVAVSPHLADFNGSICYKSIDDLPANILSLFICTQPDQTSHIIELAVSKGIKNIWLQPGSNTEEHVKYLEKHNLNVIHDRCILMFAPPVTSFHRFHRFLAKVSGNFPK